jgi:hypothetical protein
MCPLESRARCAELRWAGTNAGTVPGAAKMEEQRRTRIGSGNLQGGADRGEMPATARATGSSHAPLTAQA